MEETANVANPLNQALPEEVLKTPKAAEFLGFSERYLELLRKRGGGPPFCKLPDGAIRYLKSELVLWLKSHMVKDC